jgi:hypothetical protein
MAITSTSTHAEVIAQYNDNLSWDGDATKAALALEAVRWLLVNRPQSFSQNNRTTEYTALEQEKKRLEEYVQMFGNSANKSEFTRGVMLT